MRLISLPICASAVVNQLEHFSWWTNLCVWLYVSELLETLEKQKNQLEAELFLSFPWEIYIINASKVHLRGTETKGSQLSIQPVSEDGVSVRETGREWMSVSWRGRSDIWTPTVCHSVLPMMYGCCVAPVTHQSQSILPCWGMLQQDNGSLWPMLWNDKTPWGWGQKKLSLQGEGWVLFYSILQGQQSCGGT